MAHHVYVVATIKSWNIKIYHEVIKHFPGEWHLITDPKDLTAQSIKALGPEYIFFPHWSNIVPAEILKLSRCVCFHETDLPYGRGGSPVQNLIVNGHRETVITAFQMTKELDAGPIYLKQPLSLEGLAEEIFIRASAVVAEMIRQITKKNLKPKKQTGKTVVLKRRTPKQSEVPVELENLNQMFDHLRMLDAEGYPRAYIERGSFRYEISRPALKAEEIVAEIRITKVNRRQK
ncbi:MAG: methionyl-tRNA formyltransferase [Candidatus Omnitrophica bacterium]|nr:methionyl-tRNA formyltransferase [Candidatus Omnitrophota bacterium]